MKLETLKTPGLVLDVAKVKRNAERMSRRIKQLGADLRPHIKTHKCIEVARIQTAGHSGAVTVSTLAEARAFAPTGSRKSPTLSQSNQGNLPKQLKSQEIANCRC
jgi:D-serine deaminase-like pyridoxal phosphate-dependent protein